MEWRVIEKYDALRKKPTNAVFYFVSSVNGSFILQPVIQTSRIFGRRVCTHYLPLPSPPEG
jgi:hypothetical protein